MGSFIDDTGEAKDLNTLTVDMMFKYQNVSVMAEFVDRKTDDNDPRIFSTSEGAVVGEYYTGNALNIQAGYMFDSNWEVAARYTDVNPDEFVASPEVQYTLGLSKFVVGHKLKVQADWTYRDIFEGTDSFIWRTQMDIHF